MTHNNLAPRRGGRRACAASPLARPADDRDRHALMHRVGAPDVSRDGHWAVFTMSDTDWRKNKRNNTLHLLDLTQGRRRAACR